MSDAGPRNTAARPSQVVDCHAHAVPAKLLQMLDQGTGRLGYGFGARSTDRGWLVEVPGSSEPRLVGPTMTAPDARAEWCVDQGVHTQVLSPWMDVQPTDAMTPRAARDWVSMLNETMLELANGTSAPSPVLASLTVHDPERAAVDLRTWVVDCAMAGAVLSTNPPGQPDLAAPELEPLWAQAEELGVPVMLHPPTAGPAAQIPDSAAYGNVYCRLVDTTFAAARLILSGVLDRHPGLRLILVHGGGFLPYQSGRLDGGHRTPALAGHHLDRGDPSAYLGDLFFDTVALSAPSIRFLVDSVGSSRVLLGSDYPFPLGGPHPVQEVHDAGLDRTDTENVLGASALSILAGVAHG